jgi:hypothetical protein
MAPASGLRGDGEESTPLVGPIAANTSPQFNTSGGEWEGFDVENHPAFSPRDLVPSTGKSGQSIPRLAVAD